jgi:hypothetical protein
VADVIYYIMLGAGGFCFVLFNLAAYNNLSTSKIMTDTIATFYTPLPRSRCTPLKPGILLFTV